MNKKNIISASDNVALKLAVLAREKESVRKKLAVTAKKLKEFYATLEKKVKEKTAQLDAANQQLKASNQQLRASNQQLNANTQQLRAANQQLAATGEVLKEKIAELKVFNKATVGRELKMVELKKEIEILRKQAEHS